MTSIQFDFRFDALAIQQELQAIIQSFQAINSLKIAEYHLQGMHLINPAPEGLTDAQGYTYVSTPELDQSPYLQSVLDTFQCNKLMFRVHNLVAGGKIDLHRDSDRGLVNNIVRIHIPVTTNDQVYFIVGGKRVIMKNGECWFADITQLHEVENRSATDRWQLMIDCDLNDWWKNILAQHGVQVAEQNPWKNFSLEDLQGMKNNLTQQSADVDLALLAQIDQAIAQKS